MSVRRRFKFDGEDYVRFDDLQAWLQEFLKRVDPESKQRVPAYSKAIKKLLEDAFRESTADGSSARGIVTFYAANDGHLVQGVPGRGTIFLPQGGAAAARRRPRLGEQIVFRGEQYVVTAVDYQGDDGGKDWSLVVRKV